MKAYVSQLFESKVCVSMVKHPELGRKNQFTGIIKSMQMQNGQKSWKSLHFWSLELIGSANSHLASSQQLTKTYKEKQNI
jgi:hypothetical protein